MAGLTIELARGMAQRLNLEPGTTVLVRRGTIRLRLPPQWLAETWIQDELRLDAENRHVATSGGCIEIAALDSAEVMILDDPAGTERRFATQAPPRSRWLPRLR